MSKKRISIFERFKKMIENTPTMKKWGIISWIATITLSSLFIIFVFRFVSKHFNKIIIHVTHMK